MSVDQKRLAVLREAMNSCDSWIIDGEWYMNSDLRRILRTEGVSWFAGKTLIEAATWEVM